MRALVVLLGVLAASAQAGEKGLAHRLDTLLKERQPHAFHGVVLVARGDTTLYARAQGLSDLERSTPLRRESQFIIGSVSKQMTAAMILRGADAGRIRLHEPIHHQLPSPGDAWTRQVTVEQLLNHTSGIDRLGAPLRSEPGKTFVYTNIEYDLLGQIVEHTEGKPFGVVASELFKRCGMSASASPPKQKLSDLRQRYPSLATGYTESADGSRVGEDGLLEVTSIASGGLLSTAGDLLLWNRCLHEGRLLQPATYKAMITPAPNAVRELRWGRLGYGYGIQTLTEDGIIELSHGGYVPGYITTLLYYPQSRTSLVVLENTSWRADDLARAFVFHDRLRTLVRRGLTD